MDDKVQQFVALTGSTSNQAISMLEACAGDLDMAINMHLECVGGGNIADVGGASENTTSGVGRGVAVAAGSAGSALKEQENKTYEEMYLCTIA